MSSPVLPLLSVLFHETDVFLCHVNLFDLSPECVLQVKCGLGFFFRQGPVQCLLYSAAVFQVLRRTKLFSFTELQTCLVHIDSFFLVYPSFILCTLQITLVVFSDKCGRRLSTHFWFTSVTDHVAPKDRQYD